MRTCQERRCNRLAIIFAVVFTLTSVFSICYADTVTIPDNFYIGTYVPFGNCGNGTYQQVYDASLFPGPRPLIIDELTFYRDTSGGPGNPNSGFGPGNYQISLSTTKKPVGGLDPYDLAGAIGNDNQIFFDRFLSGGSSISGTPFFYNPQKGNLLLTIVESDKVLVHDQTGVFIRGDVDLGVSRAYYFPDVGAGPPHNSNDAGLVTTFTFRTVPEPSTMLLLGSGLLGLWGAKSKFRKWTGNR